MGRPMLMGNPLEGVPEPTWYTCPRCQTESARRGLCWECETADRATEERAYQASLALEALPGEYAWAVFGARELFERVKPSGLVVEAGKNCRQARVTIHGPGESGKTALVVAMARDAITRAKASVVFVSAHQLNAGQRELDHDWIRAPLLVLDGVGSERGTQGSLLSNLIYERHNAGRALWVTTDLDAESAGKRYGAHLARRLFSRAKVLKTGGY
jgi:DNA replication protein DnaC